jgi:hypothetical protein
MSTTPLKGKIAKKKKAKPVKHVYKTSFTVEGPVLVQSAFGTYSIGQGDSATFNTDKGKKIIVSRCANAITVIQPSDLTQSFVVDTLGPHSSATMDFGGAATIRVNKGTMTCHF